MQTAFPTLKQDLATASSPIKNGRVEKSELLASALFFLSLWYFWGVRYGDYLYAVQENSLFIFRTEFLTRWLIVPDGFLCYLTSFFIQFFYYPLLGGALLAVLGVAVQRSTAHFLGWHGGAYAVSFVPTCLLTIASTWHGYFVFIPFNTPLMFSSLLGVLFTHAGLGIYGKLRLYYRRFLFGTFFVSLGYLFFGAWASIAGFFFAIFELTQREEETDKINWRRNVQRSLLSAALAVLIPLALQYFWLYPRLQIYNVFDSGLLEEVRYERDSLTALIAYGLVRITPLCLFALYLTSRLLLLRPQDEVSSRAKRRAERRRRRLEEKRVRADKGKGLRKKDAPTDDDPIEEERATSRRRTALLFELLFLIGVATFYGSYHTRAFFDRLSACRALTCSDWDQILEIDAKNPYPVGLMVGMRNFALYKTGRLVEEAFVRPIGFYQTRALSVEDEARALAGNPYYRLKVKLHRMKLTTERHNHRALSELIMCYYGLSNVGARIATDNFVAVESRSVSCLKTLAIAAIINGEKELARRYLRELSQTLFHKDWAKVRLAYLETRDFYENVNDYNNDQEYASAKLERRANLGSLLTASDAASRFGVDVDPLAQFAELITQSRALRPRENEARNKKFPNLTYLIDVVKLDEYDDSPIEKKELILIAALMQKNGSFFLEKVDDYLALKGCSKGGAPRAIEQGYATWRYAQFDEKWNECEYKFTPETLEGMDGFIQFTKSFGAGPKQQVVLRRFCAGCYWGFAVDDAAYREQ